MTTNGGRRLDRLFPVLTPRERAVLVLRAWKEDREPEPQLLQSRRPSDAHEYNRLIGLLQASSGELTHFAVLVHFGVKELGTRFAWFLTAVLWGNELDVEYPRAEQLCDLLAEKLRAGISLRSQELDALDVVLGEIAEEFDGEDPIKPSVRAIVEETRVELERLRRDAKQYLGGSDTEDRTNEQVAALRRLVKDDAAR